MPKSVRFTLKNDPRIIQIDAPTVDQYEMVAAQFIPGQLAGFPRQLIAASISSVGGTPRTIDWDPFTEFPHLAQWRQMEKAYARLIDEKALREQANTIRAIGDIDNLTVVLPSGATVVLRSLTLDDEEELLFKNRYTANDWLKAAHDQVIAAVVRFNGKPLSPGQNLRVEIPAAEDWMLLALVHSLLNGSEDIPDFLPDTPA
ncbi:hypothetical protein GC173_11585 [bacterium]|nr:hypothetical protein [bacterium]